MTQKTEDAPCPEMKTRRGPIGVMAAIALVDIGALDRAAG